MPPRARLTVPSQAAPNRIRWARCVRRGVPARPARIGVGM